MVKVYQLPAYAGARGFNVRPSNSSRAVDTQEQGVQFDKDSLYYDMKGDKFMIILNHHTFEETNHFRLKPSTRRGTYRDEWRLQQVFSNLGFVVILKRNLKYEAIINFLTSFAASDHTRTSCICVSILTHGAKGDQIHAADRSYLLSEVMDIFTTKRSLVNKPKLFFVQACRGGRMDPGHTVKLGVKTESVLTTPTFSSSKMPACHSASEDKVLMMHGTLPMHTDASFFGSCCSFFKLFSACRDFWTNYGNTDATRWESENANMLTVPSHADTLVLRSTVENYVSYRKWDGSWMIQALCDTIEDHHEDLNLLDMIILMNRKVAYEKITSGCKFRPMNNKKQMPETRFTLTKNLKFKTELFKGAGSFQRQS